MQPLCRNIRQPAYPGVEKGDVSRAYVGGVLWAPAVPAFDCFVAPDAYTVCLRCCGQALEVGRITSDGSGVRIDHFGLRRCAGCNHSGRRGAIVHSRVCG